ncbi:MAG TPA: hypothetical protein VEW70_02480 [Burkholderiales bacterium]|nr:hypothetical protein [Burkholderiales bacterium]
MSASIVPFLKDGSFDPGTIHAMSAAFDRARKLLHDRGQPGVVLEIIATRIIAIAAAGERDPDQMCQQALATFGIDRID